MTIFAHQPTADGSNTFYSPQFDENFHSKYGAKTEADTVYVQGCRLREKMRQQTRIRILDICYGLGYNTASTLELFAQLGSPCQLEIIALELNDLVPQQALAQNLLQHYSPNTQQLLRQLYQEKQLTQSSLKLRLLIGDARQTIQQITTQNFLADAIFLDPFSPPKCPQLWTVEFINLLALCLQPQGIIATYSAAACVRQALQLSGLQIGHNFVVGERSPGTIATYEFTPLPPLTTMSKEHLQTRASVPFRDPDLHDDEDTIRHRREQEQYLSMLEPTSQWKKRWTGKNQ